jgi:uncharacterized protein (TIGR02246 family)
MRRITVTTGLALALCLGLAARATPQNAVRSAIEAANKQFAAALSRGDAAAIAALYTTNAQAFPPNSPVVSGRAGIEKMWKGVVDSGIAGASLATTDVEAHGDAAFETGTYEMKLKDGKVADSGKYVVVWKRENGQWRIHRDIWNTSMPATK